MPYRYVLTNLAGSALSELPRSTGKTVAAGVNGMGTSSVTVRADSEDADYLLGDALLRVYDEPEPHVDGPTVLVGHHRLQTAEENAADRGATVAATFADPYWTLTKRLVGKSPAGYSRGTALAPVDPGLTIITELVNAANAESPTGLRMGSVGASTRTYVSGWFYKPLAEVIAELSATLGGPDWTVRPIEYVPGAGGLGVYGELDVLPTVGTPRPDAAWEYGDGLLNVASYKRAVSYQDALNRAYSLPPGFPDNVTNPVVSAVDARSQGLRGILEGLVTSDLPVDALRQALVDLHVRVRAGGRQTITFQPVRDAAGRLPRFRVDFDVGDTLPFRATVTRPDGALVKRVDATVRVYGYSVAVDEHGAGTPTLSVTPT